MALTLETTPVPLRVWEDGSIRVGGTRVTLETVLGEFIDGATPEHIVLSFDTLRLADVYAVIAHYLRNKEEIDAYLEGRRRLGEEARKENKRRFPDHKFIRERLMARRATAEAPAKP